MQEVLIISILAQEGLYNSCKVIFKQYVKLINYLFNLRPGVLIKTLSHIWGRLNLPILLFRVGLLTLMKMDSLMYLDIWCPSFPIILKLFWLMQWLVWLLW